MCFVLTFLWKLPNIIIIMMILLTATTQQSHVKMYPLLFYSRRCNLTFSQLLAAWKKQFVFIDKVMRKYTMRKEEENHPINNRAWWITAKGKGKKQSILSRVHPFFVSFTTSHAIVHSNDDWRFLFIYWK